MCPPEPLAKVSTPGYLRGPTTLQSQFQVEPAGLGSQLGTSKFLASLPPFLPPLIAHQLEDLRGGPQHQGRELRRSSVREHLLHPPTPQPTPQPRFPGNPAAGWVRVLAHRLALPRYSGTRSGEIGASSAESRGARGGNQSRRARGLPSARMSAGAGSRSVWRVAAPTGCAARGPSPAVARPVASRRSARCASLPPGRPAR